MSNGDPKITQLVGLDVTELYMDDGHFDFSKGVYFRPYFPITLGYKLLGFDNEQKWLQVNLQAKIGYQFNFQKNTKTRASQFFGYGTGLQFVF